MTDIKVMKIGSGKSNEVNPQTGTRTRIRGYAYRAGKSLHELVNEYGAVKIVAMGEASVNNMVKAIVHAQNRFKAEDKWLVANDFCFEDTVVGDSENEHTIKTVTVYVTLAQ